MWVRKWESGWGSKANNVHAFSLPANAKKFERLVFNCKLKQSDEALSFTLRDESGCTYPLPAIITKDIGKFTIITDGCSESTDYKFELVVSAWPKELELPIAKYFSITTVEISPHQITNNPNVTQPVIRFRRKGTNEWTDGNQIIFKNVDEIYECQSYCLELPNIHSPTIEVKCMWNSFNIEKDCTIDVDKMFVNGKFVFSFNSQQSVQNTEYEAYIKMIKPVDHPDYHKEILVQSHLDPDKYSDYLLVPGAQYEFKIRIKGLNITYSKFIEVPKLHPINVGLWKKYFGDVEMIGFYQVIGDHYLFDYELYYATLYKNGLFTFNKKYQKAKVWVAVDEVKFGANFTLTPIDSTTVRVDFLKVYHVDSKREAPPRARTILSPHPHPHPQPKFLQQGPQALQISDIMDMITRYMEDVVRMQLRLVCRSWSHMVQPLMSFTCTSTTAQVLGADMQIENEKARVIRETEGTGWSYEYRYSDA